MHDDETYSMIVSKDDGTALFARQWRVSGGTDLERELEAMEMLASKLSDEIRWRKRKIAKVA